MIGYRRFVFFYEQLIEKAVGAFTIAKPKFIIGEEQQNGNDI